MKKNNDKKEIKYLNVCMNKFLHEEFEQFCKDMEMSKTECFLSEMINIIKGN